MVLKIAHRGASSYAPENTLESFNKAIKLKADVVEFDVQRTKDNKIVVIHSYNVKKTTNGVGLVKNLLFREIRKFYGPNGESIPTLQETLDVLKNKCVCKIDIKSRFIEESVLKSIKMNNMEKDVIITSKIFSVLKKIRRLSPKIKIEAGGSKRDIPIEEIINKAKSVKADIVSPHHSIATPALIRQVHRKGLKIHVWTVNDKKTIEKMKKLGVDGITTDSPDKI